MFCFKKGLIVLQILVVSVILIKAEPNWIFEIISITTDNKRPDILNVTLERTRISRGIFAITGTFDVKEDMDDKTYAKADIYYSPVGSNYARTPFRVTLMPLSNALNSFYKDMLVESLQGCSLNLPEIEPEFKAPLTKRVISLDKCVISNEKMPSNLRTGYYKLVICFQKHADTDVEITVKIEAKE